jgi:predicted transcriptional regulator of viral defense system
MPPRLEHLADNHILTLQEAASLLGLENLTLESLASRKAYGLKSRMYKTKRSFIVADLRASLTAREQSTV